MLLLISEDIYKNNKTNANDNFIVVFCGASVCLFFVCVCVFWAWMFNGFVCFLFVAGCHLYTW